MAVVMRRGIAPVKNMNASRGMGKSISTWMAMALPAGKVMFMNMSMSMGMALSMGLSKCMILYMGEGLFLTKASAMVWQGAWILRVMGRDGGIS